MREWLEDRMEELLPVVAKLSDKYTGGMSTSVTYEKAQELMEAVLYCIREYEQEPSSGFELMVTEDLPMEEIYKRGYELVVRKVKKMRLFYNTISKRFCSYECCNYENVIQNEMPEFFRRYDPQFAPQKNLLMFDYPILLPLGKLTGIDAVEHYLSSISLEQRFLGAFDETYVCRILSAYDWNYREQFYNLCRIFLRHMLDCILIGKRLEEPLNDEQVRILKSRVKGRDPEEMEQILCGLLKQMVEQQFRGNEFLYEYLKADMKDFATILVKMEPRSP